MIQQAREAMLGNGSGNRRAHNTRCLLALSLGGETGGIAGAREIVVENEI
jgi:hypothetical protein